MPIPSHVGSAGFSSTFASSLVNSFNVGVDPVSIFAFAAASANTSLTRVNSITLNPAGTPLVMTPGTDRSLNTELTTVGRCRAFEAIATGLTGVVNFDLRCTDLNGVADANAKPGVFFIWVKDGVSATNTPRTGPLSAAGGSNMTGTIASDTNSRVFGLLLTDGLPANISGVGGTTKDGSGALSDWNGVALSELGATSTVLEALTSTTASYLGQLWSVTGSAVANPILTGNVQAEDAVASGSLAPTPPSSLTGNVQADDAVASGTLATQLGTVITLPFSRNPGNGARPVSIANVAVAVLTDDANLARLVGSTGLLMGSNGRLTLANQVPAPPGTSVVVVTREPDGKLGVERYALS